MSTYLPALSTHGKGAAQRNIFPAASCKIAQPNGDVKGKMNGENRAALDNTVRLRLTECGDGEYSNAPSLWGFTLVIATAVLCVTITPIMLIDPWGFAPGDEFDSANAALIDFAKSEYAITYYTRLEISSWLYSMINADGNKVFVYSKPVVGEPHAVDLPSEDILPEGVTKEGAIHTHPSMAAYSDADINSAANMGLPIYLVVDGDEPGGIYASIMKGVYSEENNFQTEMVNMRLVECDYLSIRQRMALYYFTEINWKHHLYNTRYDSNDGCSSKQWPRTVNGRNENWGFINISSIGIDYLRESFDNMIYKNIVTQK